MSASILSVNAPRRTFGEWEQSIEWRQHFAKQNVPFDLSAILNQLTHTERRVWDELSFLGKVSKTGVIQCSQGGYVDDATGEYVEGYLERKLGKHPDTINRAVARLEALGLIDKTFRRRNRKTGRWCACLYVLVPMMRWLRQRVINAGKLGARLKARREAKQRARALAEQHAAQEREEAERRRLERWQAAGFPRPWTDPGEPAHHNDRPMYRSVQRTATPFSSLNATPVPGVMPKKE